MLCLLASKCSYCLESLSLQGRRMLLQNLRYKELIAGVACAPIPHLIHTLNRSAMQARAAAQPEV